MIINITLAQLVSLLKSDMQFKLIDVTPIYHFREGHIPGAVSIPKPDIETLAPALLSKEEMLIVYGEDIFSNTAEMAAEKLELLGFRRIIHFPGGLEDYCKHMLPLESMRSIAD
jgi:rhodanese-related sulfurtransferase